MRACPTALVLAAILIISAEPAAAQAERRFYVGGFGGASFLLDPELEVAGTSAGEAEFEQGFAAGAMVGYRFVDDFRGELEASFRQNDLDILFTASAEGDATVWALMANGYYDFPDISGSARTPIRPYLGGGLGVARVSWNDVSIGATQIVDDDEYLVAYQAIAGIGIGVTDSVTLSVDYRFVATPDVELDQPGGSNAFQIDNLSHTVTGGIRVAF